MDEWGADLPEHNTRAALNSILREPVHANATHVSESYDWAERDSQVVVCAFIEVDLIARFEAKSDGAKRRFNSRAGVESGIHIRSTQVEDWADNVNVRQQAGAQSKVHEACFQGGKGMKMALASDEGWAEQSMGDSDRCTLDRQDVARDYVAISFIEI
jgi:hypothetical protein